MSEPATPIEALALKPVTVYQDADGKHYTRLTASEAAKSDGAVRGVTTTTSKKNGESKRYAFYQAV